jgi:hypothetical protein
VKSSGKENQRQGGRAHGCQAAGRYSGVACKGRPRVALMRNPGSAHYHSRKVVVNPTLLLTCDRQAGHDECRTRADPVSGNIQSKRRTNIGSKRIPWAQPALDARISRHSWVASASDRLIMRGRVRPRGAWGWARPQCQFHELAGADNMWEAADQWRESEREPTIRFSSIRAAGGHHRWWARRHLRGTGPAAAGESAEREDSAPSRWEVPQVIHNPDCSLPKTLVKHSNEPRA